MTTTTISRGGGQPGGQAARRAAGRYGFREAAGMEWLKLRTVRSTWWILLVFAASMIGLAIVTMHLAPAHPGPDFDPTETGFAGLGVAQLAAGVLGVLVISSEYSSGMIRATLAAVPRRPLVLAAKAAVLAAWLLAAGEALAFAAFFAGHAALPGTVPHPALSQPGVLRAVLMAGAYPCLVGLLGLGLGAVIRHTAGAISAVVGVVFVLPLIMIPLPEATRNAAGGLMPEEIAENSLTAVKPVAYALTAWAGLGMLCLYAAVALAVGGWLLARRDA